MSRQHSLQAEDQAVAQKRALFFSSSSHSSSYSAGPFNSRTRLYHQPGLAWANMKAGTERVEMKQQQQETACHLSPTCTAFQSQCPNYCVLESLKCPVRVSPWLCVMELGTQPRSGSSCRKSFMRFGLFLISSKTLLRSQRRSSRTGM